MAKRNAEKKEFPATVTDVLRLRHTERVHKEVPTAAGDAMALVDEGSQPELGLRQLGRYARIAAGVHTRKLFLNAREKIQERHKGTLKDAAQQNPGFTGIRWPGKGFSLLMSKSTSLNFTRPGLRAALGDSYSAAVHDRVDVGIMISSDIETEKGRLTAELATTLVRQSFLDAGMSEEQLNRIITTEVTPLASEQTLWDMVRDGRVSEDDMNQAGTASYTWSLRTDELS